MLGTAFEIGMIGPSAGDHERTIEIGDPLQAVGTRQPAVRRVLPDEADAPSRTGPRTHHPGNSRTYRSWGSTSGIARAGHTQTEGRSRVLAGTPVTAGIPRKHPR